MTDAEACGDDCREDNGGNQCTEDNQAVAEPAWEHLPAAHAHLLQPVRATSLNCCLGGRWEGSNWRRGSMCWGDVMQSSDIHSQDALHLDNILSQGINSSAQAALVVEEWTSMSRLFESTTIDWQWL